MKRAAAFSLLEVLIALLIVAIVSFAVSTTILASSKSNANNRTRSRAVAAANAWLDRFRSYSLPFGYFSSGVDYDYGYDYASDPVITASNDPNLAEVAQEWSKYKFYVKTTSISNNPAIWRIEVVAYYKKKGGGEGHFQLVTVR